MPIAPASANAAPSPGVVAPVEFAVGAFEVVLVEAALVDDQPVVADLEHVQIGRLVAGVIGPAAPVQIEALTAYGQNAPLKVVVLLKDSLNSGSQLGLPVMGSPLSRRRSSYTRPIREATACSVDVVRRIARWSVACTDSHDRFVTASRLVVARTRSSA